MKADGEVELSCDAFCLGNPYTQRQMKKETLKKKALHWDARDLDTKELLSGQVTAALGEPLFHFEKMWPEAEMF